MDAISAAARPWIEAAKPSYPCLIDLDHRVADLYHMVNVPQAVWIDETGHIVRPTESAGAYEGFRAMDRATRKVPDEVAAITSLAKRTYVDAVRDWVFAEARASTHSRRRPPSPICPCRTTPSRGRTRTFVWDSTCSGTARPPPRGPSSTRPAACTRTRGTSGARRRRSTTVGWRPVRSSGRASMLSGSRRYYAPVDMEGMPD